MEKDSNVKIQVSLSRSNTNKQTEAYIKKALEAQLKKQIKNLRTGMKYTVKTNNISGSYWASVSIESDMVKSKMIGSVSLSDGQLSVIDEFFDVDISTLDVSDRKLQEQLEITAKATSALLDAYNPTTQEFRKVFLRKGLRLTD